MIVLPVRPLRFLSLALGLGALLLLAPAARADDTKRENTAAKPSPKDVNRHEGFVKQAKRGGIDLLFLGDSITDAWGGEGHRPDSAGREVFSKEFKPLKAANFGIGGDRTQHVLWRLQHGELEGINPKVVMIMIGTNNLGSNTAAEIAEGIKATVDEIRSQKPESKVLLLGIFPREAKAAAPNRSKIKEINGMIAKLDDKGKHVRYLDIGKKFMEPDGSISREIMPDYLHLSPEGYQRWADAVKPAVEELMNK
jgi:lysophospholipase L1-like esterase